MKDSTTLLQEKILLLELENENNRRAVKLQFYETYESFKPVNLINSYIESFKVKTPMPEGILGTTALTVSNLISSLLGDTTKSPYKRAAVNVLQYIMVSLANQYNDSTEEIVSKVKGLFSRGKKKKKDKAAD
ncbi:MAG: hypothetical protein ACXITV_12035 [Luteibaculaceae bacterium]